MYHQLNCHRTEDFYTLRKKMQELEHLATQHLMKNQQPFDRGDGI